MAQAPLSRENGEKTKLFFRPAAGRIDTSFPLNYNEILSQAPLNQRDGAVFLNFKE